MDILNVFNHQTYQLFPITYFLTKKEFEASRGNPPFKPLKNLKISDFSKLTPRDHVTSYNTVFLLYNQLVLSK